jgi:hypothetical protein
MAFRYWLSLILILFLGAASQGSPQEQTATPANAAAPPTAAKDAAAAPLETPSLTPDQVIDRAIANENSLIGTLAKYTPMVETYIQNLESDKELGAVPKSDRYFLGKLDLKDGVNERSLLPEPGFAKAITHALTQIYSVRYLPNGFAQMILIDGKHFNREHYIFEYVRREFLGEVKCLVFDVQPNPNSKDASFLGRIWVEDRDNNIVRFNGTYSGSSMSKMYFHFDSWREQMGPGKWMPAYVYSEESDMNYFLNTRKLKFKGQTRLWGYNTGRPNAQNEFTSLVVEADKIEDNGDAAEHMSPVLSQRAWVRQAEDNMLQRMQKAGLMAPEGEVDKVLQTVITNIEVTNNLNIIPETRTRVLLTSPLETFSVGHTIVISRGLVDVLPDEASLAMVLAHELAHISLGHRLDTKYAFNDRMLFDDTDTFHRLHVKRDDKEEKEADKRAIELLQNSPYKDKLGTAGLFLRALRNSADELPNLLKAHMGNRIADGKEIRRMTELMSGAPELEATKVEQIAALPLGGRLRVDPWTNRLELVKAKPVALLSAREKMPFEVTPVVLYLTRQKDAGTAATSKNNN